MVKKQLLFALRRLTRHKLNTTINVLGLTLGVLLSTGIAGPIAGWAMHKWLEDFAYRTTVPWYIYGIAGLGAVAIALITVSFQAIRAATANPVDSLRSE